MLGPLATLGVLAAAQAPPTDTPKLGITVRVALGAEWDTNARRAVPDGGADPLSRGDAATAVDPDAVGRLVFDGRSLWNIDANTRLSGRYTLGAKRFTEQATEDLLNHNLSAVLAHRFSDVVRSSIGGRFRASRIRRGTRDYDLGSANADLWLSIGRWWDILLTGGWSAFGFSNEPRFDFNGPRVGVQAEVRPTARLRFTAALYGVLRAYEGNALVEGTQTDPEGRPTQPVFCDGDEGDLACTPAGHRRDSELQPSVSFQYRHGFVLGGQYLLRLQRSNSDYENIDRHRISLFGSVPLPLEVSLNVAAALQINNGASITDTKFLAEDDENQNSVQVGLSREVFDGLTVEARYALFANQFSTANASFVRQTFYLGLGYRVGASL